MLSLSDQLRYAITHSTILQHILATEPAALSAAVSQAVSSNIKPPLVQPVVAPKPVVAIIPAPVPAAVVPANMVWMGGGKNLASDAKDWDLHRVPTVNDQLFMYGGTMNVVGDALHGAVMQINAARSTKTKVPSTNSVVNYTNAVNERLFITSNPEPVTLNFTGTSTLTTLFGGAKVNVNIAPNSTWNGRFIQFDITTTTSLTINGAAGSKFNNNVVNDYDQSTGNVTFNVDVGGTGIFAISHSRMEFSRAVGAGQTINEGASDFSTVPSVLVLDKPTSFAGLLSLYNGEVDLKGLVADSYNYQNNVLSLFKGDKLVDTMRMQASQFTTDTLRVMQTGSGVVFGDLNHTSAVAGVVLPVHV